MKVYSHYTQNKSDKVQERDVKEVRYMTRDEARNIPRNPVLVLSDSGRYANAKVTSIKTWKRDPLRVKVNLQYGMYEYFSEEFTKDKNETRLIVEV